MRALDWQNALQRQKDEHRKVVFTGAELANLSGSRPGSLGVALRRLVQQGVLVRYASGCYGRPGSVAPEDLVPVLDSTAYLTGHYALHSHRLVNQMPAEMVCHTRRRHNRSRVRITPLGRIVFICIESPVYAMPPDGVLAGPEQAFCDFVHLCCRRGMSADSLLTFRNLDRLDPRTLAATAARYPATVRRETERILNREP
jgi:hypothetical protein